mmetsp:Transcript_51969/g.86010  ORF Transcript_51969/g.86010 Transcript_51969/m.86010 type:complete len:280 (-) Transcript_51969:457-1296(-)
MQTLYNIAQIESGPRHIFLRITTARVCIAVITAAPILFLTALLRRQRQFTMIAPRQRVHIHAALCAFKHVVKKMQQQTTPTIDDILTVVQHIPHLLLVAFQQRSALSLTHAIRCVILRGSLQHVLDLIPVGKRVIQNAARECTITTSASRLLIIVLDRFRHRGMNDKADIVLVDAHTKRTRGNHHTHFIRGPLSLVLGTFRVRQASMIHDTRNLTLLQEARILLAIFPGHTINNTATISIRIANERRNLFPVLFFFLAHFPEQIATIHVLTKQGAAWHI